MTGRHRPPGFCFEGSKWSGDLIDMAQAARCVGRSRLAGDRSGERAPYDLGLRWFPVPREVISVAVRWYLRYGLSYRDVEELLAERGVTVDHVTIYRWVQLFTPEFIEAARRCRHAPGDRWFADETYLKVGGTRAYLYRTIDQHGQVVDVLLSATRDLAAARRFFTRALREHGPGRGHHRPRARLPAGPGRTAPLGPPHHGAVREQPDRGRPRTAQGPDPADAGPETSPLSADLAAGHAFVQNLRLAAAGLA
jgi:transposase, IS6 family